MIKHNISPDWTVDPLELAWAAGFYDGEGTVYCKPNGKRNSQKLFTTLAVSQTDPRPLHRMKQALLGMGTVTGPHIAKNQPGTKPVWKYYINRAEHIQMAMCLMWASLSGPKREQFCRVRLQRMAGVNCA